MFTFLTNALPLVAEVVANEYFSQGLAYIGAGIAVFTGFGTAIG